MLEPYIWLERFFMASNRNSFDNIYKWNVKDLYENDELALQELEELSNEINRLKEYENH